MAHTADDAHATLRETLREYLHQQAAHVDYDTAVADLPPRLRGSRPHPDFPHTPWRLIEHIRLAQRDIIDFIHDPDYTSPVWPQGYWPDTDAPPHGRAWQRSTMAFRCDARHLRQLVADPAIDLLAPIAHAPDYTIAREIILVIDHTAYHLGQLVTLRRLLGAWP